MAPFSHRLKLRVWRQRLSPLPQNPEEVKNPPVPHPGRAARSAGEEEKERGLPWEVRKESSPSSSFSGAPRGSSIAAQPRSSAAQPRRARLSRARRKFRSSRGEKKCEHPQEARWGTERCPVLPDSLQQNAHLAWSSFLCRERGGQVANDLTRLVLYKG